MRNRPGKAVYEGAAACATCVLCDIRMVSKRIRAECRASSPTLGKQGEAAWPPVPVGEWCGDHHPAGPREIARRKSIGAEPGKSLLEPYEEGALEDRGPVTHMDAGKDLVCQQTPRPDDSWTEIEDHVTCPACIAVLNERTG